MCVNVLVFFVIFRPQQQTKFHRFRLFSFLYHRGAAANDIVSTAAFKWHPQYPFLSIPTIIFYSIVYIFELNQIELNNCIFK